MQINLKYYKQTENLSSCGPVCLKMIFEHLGKKYSERQLIKICNAVPGKGTSHKDLINAVKKAGFLCKFGNGSVKEIISYVKYGHPVIVNYLNPRSGRGHYSIVISIDDGNGKLIFADPSNGEGYSLSINEFEKIWHNLKKTSWRWFLVIDKEKINLNYVEDESKE